MLFLVIKSQIAGWRKNTVVGKNNILETKSTWESLATFLFSVQRIVFFLWSRLVEQQPT